MALQDPNSVKANENTPLIQCHSSKAVKYGKSVLYRALLCGFVVSLSFGVTQVPLLYVFRLMTCDAYYTTHPEPAHGDRCENRMIEAGTARAYSILGASTTFFGMANLFITGWAIKKLGAKSALLNSVFWPAVRLLIQNIGVMHGGATGMLIIQCSQIICIVGGPAGYLLALNSYVAEILEPSERTGALGKLQGCAFLGMSLAYFLGGLITDVFGLIAPFRVTLALFTSSSIYVALFLPWIAPDKTALKVQKTKLSRFFGPLKIFTPRKWMMQNGQVRMEYGTILLGFGVFLGVLATGFIPVLLQMYATDVYAFGATENGYLISLNSFIRGIFLTFVFPVIISYGRARYSNPKHVKDCEPSPESDTNLPTEPSDFAATAEVGERDEEPMPMPHLENGGETFDFDLQYSRWSILADSLLTGCATFVTEGWQLYVVAVLLPLASGTGSSAKGVIIQMCSPSERTDALSAITLVEMVARLTTRLSLSLQATIFGFIFAAFAEAGKINLVFTCNAAVASVAFIVLLFAAFPPDGSKRVEEAVPEETSSLLE
ncbi:major facilitator superfamily transporter [Drepanopeziza brunnea f. sp. 'multigermtubi' MB_m1]|uniref:Major facilitator superfamily transporter n=1 Tax=Marssonina brunnea f. sp. multigermtubi (strain MB_m1) TaxID=1072389 RepID=K1XS57_MARBU|nr:major facilitator superfamily transporter [Drepanopeziza brunnea f. sp. 'multigermtubi' MB_m1]EKD15409.1 major facilitator superfamily transporter [Drepanopeziza brunnea f. sp. 'multigermtubi' MB_m1]